MSREEAERWDRKYRDGGYPDRREPSPLVREHAPALPRGPALDLGCGLGRNALYLAQLGYAVQGLDVSAVAIAQARRRSADLGLSVDWQVTDLDDYAGPPEPCALILCCRLLVRPLLPRIALWLRPGGVLLFEHHLDSPREALAGPRNPAHRLRPNELLGLLPGLRLLHYDEGLFPGAGRAPAALVRALAQRPPHEF